MEEDVVVTQEDTPVVAYLIDDEIVVALGETEVFSHEHIEEIVVGPEVTP